MRGHAALLTTCTTLVGASSSVAGYASELAASRKETLALAEARLGEHEQTRDQLDATMRRFHILQSAAQNLVRDMQALDVQVRDSPGEAALRGEFRRVSLAASGLASDLECIGSA